jgi:hypothetical protein
MIEKYRTQVDLLAKELNCKLVVDDKFRTTAMMYVESGYVEVPPIDNQIDYLINLHELGHVYHGHTQGRPPHTDKKFYFENGVLRSEAQAWEYALDKCIDELQDSSRIFMWDTCLGSYYSHAYLRQNGEPDRLLNGNRHHVEFAWDKPDEYFTSVVKRIQGNINDFKIAYKG